MEIRDFLAFAFPFTIVIYGAFILFMRPPKAVIVALLLAGLLVGIINIAFDLLAYYAHWWHYILNGLILHLPLPFYISSVLIYGGVAYLLIWRFWRGRSHWIAMLLLIGVPILGIVRDVLGGLSQTSYATWDNVPLSVVA